MQGCARGPRQDAGRRGEHWMRSVPLRWDAERGTPAGCASQHPQGLHRTAPPRDAQNGTHTGCTSLQPRGRHSTAPTRDAHRRPGAGCTARHPHGGHGTAPTRHPHGTHSAAPGRDAWCRVWDAGGGTGRRCWQCREQRAHKAPRAAALPRQAAAALGAWGGGHRHMMGSDVGAPRVSHATACCHPHGHCGQTPGTLGTAGCCW